MFTAKDLATPTMRRIQGGLDKTSGAAEASAARMTKGFRGMALGAGIAAAGIATLGAFIGGTVTAAAKLETIMLEVKRKSGLADEQIKILTQDLLKMSATLPLSAIELAKVAAVAAQMGIKSTEDIKALAFESAQLARVADFTEETAALALGRIAEAFDLPINQAKNMGSALVELGDSTKTTAGTIAEITMRFGPFAKTLGFSAAEAFALSAAVAEAGVRAELAGTGISRFMGAAVERSAEFAEVLGMTEKDFRKAFGERPMAMMVRFLEVFRGIDKFKIPETLGKLGLAGSENLRVITGLAGKVDSLNRALGLSRDAFAKGTVLQEKFTESTKGMEAELDTLLGSLKNVAIMIGLQLLPAAIHVLEVFSGLVAAFIALSPQTLKTITLFVVLAGTITTVVGGIIFLKGAITALGAIGIVALAPFLILAAKILLVIGALVAVAFVLKKAWVTNFLGIRNVVAGFVEGLRSLWGFIVDLLRPAWDEFTGAIAEMRSRFVKILEMFGLFGDKTKATGGALQGFSKILVGIFTFGIRIAAVFVRVWLWVQTRIIKILTPIVEMFAAVIGTVAKVGGAIGRFLGLGGGEPAPAPITVGEFPARARPAAPAAPGVAPLSAAGALRQLATGERAAEAPAPARAGAQEFHTHVNIDGERVVDAVDRRRADDDLRGGRLKPAFAR